MDTLSFTPELGRGPEDVLICDDGTLLTGLEDGRVLRISADLIRVEQIGDTGGRPLGLEHLPDGRVLICDAFKGLLALTPETGALQRYADDPLPFCNNASVARDGTVYFSSSSRRHPIEHSTRDIVEARPTGSLWRCSPDGICDRLVDGLYFANGVVLSADESHVLVAETGAAGVQRHWLSGPDAGVTEPLLSGLDSLPDNMSVAAHGRIWIALVAPADAVRALWRLPFALRWLAVRLRGDGAPADRLHVMSVAPDGSDPRHIDLTAAGYRFVTGVRAGEDALYLGSIVENRIARMELPPAQRGRPGRA